MPSAHRQNNFIMERQTAMNNVAIAQLSGESSTFICTECGDGFSQYSNLLIHMAIHGPLESFSFDGSSYGFEIPREYVLQENGTLTAISCLPQSHSSKPPMKPVSPGVLPSHLPSPVKPVSPTLRSQLSSHKNTSKPKPSDLNLDNSQQRHYRCEICNRSFNSLQSFHYHQQYRNTGRGYKCTLCCKVLEDQHDFKKHLQNHIHEQFNYCDHCGKRFLKMDALNAHHKEKHPLPKALRENKEEKRLEKGYNCKKCMLSFFWISDFQIHSMYYCKGQELDSVFSSDTDMEVDSKDLEDGHLVNCQSNGTSDVKNGDSKVSKDTNSESDLKPTPYRCGLCGDCFEKLSDLKEHHLTHQTQEEIDKLNQESQNIFKRRILSKTRKRRDQNGKLHPCKHCCRVFNHSSSLSRHMRYHKGTMHNCTFCGRLFPQRCDLRRHVAMYHKAELEKKPALKHLYANPQNGPSSNSDIEKSTNTPDEKTKGASNNEMISTERSPKDKQSGRAVRGNYKCHECGKKFGLLCVYQRHLRYHKKEPNKCPHCPALFKNASSLELHLQIHPKIEKADDGIGQTSHDTATDADKPLKKDNAEDMEDNYMDQKQTDKGNSSETFYKCTECTDTFSCLDTFLQHQTAHG